MQALQSQFWTIRDYLSPVLKESKFKESDCITPEEFMLAGDFLVYKFPEWSWKTGDESKIRDFLPKDKQYLITTGVPCLRRATGLAYTGADEDAERLLSFGDLSAAGGDEWVETHANLNRNFKRSLGDSAANPIAEIQDIYGPHDSEDISGRLGGLSLSGVDEAPTLDDIPDMEEDNLEGEDEATAYPQKPVAGVNDAERAQKTNLLQVRTYDVMITYDKYCQTPHVWLIGYDENGRNLTPQQIFEDISADHANKTVTIEQFIHSTSLQAASVHPCKNSSVMKKVIERTRMNNSIVAEQLTQRSKKDRGGKDGKKKWLFGRKPGSSDKEGKKATAAAAQRDEDEIEGMRVDFYLIVFLKFIASIVPTIEVDSTAAF